MRAFRRNIKYIVIFGSAVGIHCHQKSDLDVCLIGNYEGRNMDVDIGKAGIVTYADINEVVKLAQEDEDSLEN